jgi:CDGSH-type Zn-finger protein
VQCEALAASTQDEATRATPARVAGRLSSSVVRPLCAVLESAPDPSPPDAMASAADLAHQLHLLAVEATQLRVRAAGALSLQEAAAALQELACQGVADDVERLEARRTELSALMAGLRCTIQSAPNGPYLATNMTAMTDWLGVSLDPTPQAALCRCGASAIKPWCDGSHAQIGFEDAKSDARVPDRLDRYGGVGITIADNRGTCAHSGFCTDRQYSRARILGETRSGAARSFSRGSSRGGWRNWAVAWRKTAQALGPRRPHLVTAFPRSPRLLAPALTCPYGGGCRARLVGVPMVECCFCTPGAAPAAAFLLRHAQALRRPWGRCCSATIVARMDRIQIRAVVRCLGEC